MESVKKYMPECSRYITIPMYACLLPLLKISFASLLASLIAEGVTILLNSLCGSGRTTQSSSYILLKPH